MNIDHPETMISASVCENDTTLFASLELSKSTWLVTVSISGREKLSKHGVAAGDGGALLNLLTRLRAKAEREIGVSGDKNHTFGSWRSSPYPMPPIVQSYTDRVMADTRTRAAALGLCVLGGDLLWDLAGWLGQLQADKGLPTNANEYTKQCLNFGLPEVVYRWATGMKFADVMKLTAVPEGTIVRCSSAVLFE